MLRGFLQPLAPVLPARAFPLVPAGRLLLRSLELRQPDLELIHLASQRVALGTQQVLGLLQLAPDRRVLGPPPVAIGAGGIALHGQTIAPLPGFRGLALELGA